MLNAEQRPWQRQLAHRGTGRDRFSWHRQCVMAVIALQMPGKLIISDLALFSLARLEIMSFPGIWSAITAITH